MKKKETVMYFNLSSTRAIAFVEFGLGRRERGNWEWVGDRLS